MTRVTAKCGNCRYFDRSWCRRYPKYEETTETRGCGEFVISASIDRKIFLKAMEDYPRIA
jgi:hypothetical protein